MNKRRKRIWFDSKVAIQKVNQFNEKMTAHIVFLCFGVIFFQHFQVIEAKKSKTATDPPKEYVPIGKANAEFLQCCKDEKVTKECLDYCTYDVSNRDLKNIFLKKLLTSEFGLFDLNNPSAVKEAAKNHNQGTSSMLLDGPCGYASMEGILKCANGKERGSDNRDCCLNAHVYSYAGHRCERFCKKNPYIGETTKEDVECVLKGAKRMYARILTCHYQGLKS